MVTYVFPPDGRLLGRDEPTLDGDLILGYEKVPRIRIVFSNDEGTARDVGIDSLLEDPEDIEEMGKICVADIFPISLEGLTDLFRYPMGRQGAKYEICGSEVLGDYDLDPFWAKTMVEKLVKEFNKLRPQPHKDDIVIMTRKEWKASPEAKWEMGPSELEGEDELDEESEVKLENRE